MSKDKTLLVALDLSELDDVLIKYAHFMTQQLVIEKIVFVHNIKVPELEDLYHEMIEEHDISKLIRIEIIKRIKTHFSQLDQIEILITEDISTESKLKELEKEHLNSILLLGWKTEKESSRSLIQKVVRISNSPVYLIPASASMKMDSLMLASDFSQPITKVKTFIEQWYAKDFEHKAIWRVFQVPSGFFPFLDDAKTLERTEKHVNKDNQQKIKKYNFDATWSVESVRKGEDWVGEKLAKMYRKNKYDLMLLSAKGGNKLSKLFIGSTTNEIIYGVPFGVVGIIK